MYIMEDFLNLSVLVYWICVISNAAQLYCTVYIKLVVGKFCQSSFVIQ